MRKSLWIIPVLLLIWAIGAPNALADTFTYTFTYTFPAATFSFTTVPLDPAVALGNPEAAIITDSFAGFYSGTVLVQYVLDGSNAQAPGANLLIQVTGGPSLGPPESYFSPSDYSSAGTYIGTCVANCMIGGVDILVVTAEPTPEPATGSLMLLGVGLSALLMRKRIAKDLPQAT